MTTGPIRWGILGTGKIARILAGAIRESALGEVVAVASRAIGRASAFASEFGVPRSYDDYGGLIEDDDIDLVYVATHHPTHREWAVRAAEAGKHVLCEKPIALDADGAEDIVAAARRNDVFLLEAFAYRCHPQTRRLVELLQDEAIGEVRMIDAVFGYDAGPEPDNYLLVRELAGGAIFDVGCYTTSAAHLVAGAVTRRTVEPTVVAGTAVMGSSGVDLSAGATLLYEGGVLARIACSIQANLDSTLRIYGSAGRITVVSPWLPGRIGSRAQLVVERSGASPQTVDLATDTDVYTVEVNEVNAFVAGNVRSPEAMTWEESVANMRTLDRWRASAASDDGMRLRPSSSNAANLVR